MKESTRLFEELNYVSGGRFEMTKNKIIRIVIILISLILSLMLYSSEYSIRNDVEDIEKNISIFLDKDVSVVKCEKVDNTIFVYFSDDTKENVGHTVLYRGLNFRYQIRQANYGSNNQVLRIQEFKTRFKRYWAVFGTNYDNQISKIIFDGGVSEIALTNIEEMDEILVIHESDIKTPGMMHIFEYTLFDTESNDITKDMNSYITAEHSSGFGRGKAELFLLNIFCFSIILVGYGISRLFKIKK